MASVDLFDVPRQAFRAFENLTKLGLVVHDLDGSLWPHLPPCHLQHTQPVCRAVKAAGFDFACRAFEITRLREDLVKQSQGRVHVCHAGLIEWVVPTFRDGRLQWVFFAGQRRCSKQFTPEIKDAPSRVRQILDAQKINALPGVAEDQSEINLEALRQLAARLQLWHEEMSRRSKGKSFPLADDTSRRLAIDRFIEHEHTRPVRLPDLARTLHLSRGRTAHLVREMCGSTFGLLLNAARVRTAASLLRHSNLTVLEIALRSGFGDVSHFHRVFKKFEQKTPHRFRRGRTSGAKARRLF